MLKLPGIGMLFKRLRVCWDKCEESTASIQHAPLISLIPVSITTSFFVKQSLRCGYFEDDFTLAIRAIYINV